MLRITLIVWACVKNAEDFGTAWQACLTHTGKTKEFIKL